MRYGMVVHSAKWTAGWWPLLPTRSSLRHNPMNRRRTGARLRRHAPRERERIRLLFLLLETERGAELADDPLQHARLPSAVGLLRLLLCLRGRGCLGSLVSLLPLEHRFDVRGREASVEEKPVLLVRRVALGTLASPHAVVVRRRSLGRLLAFPAGVGGWRGRLPRRG